MSISWNDPFDDQQPDHNAPQWRPGHNGVSLAQGLANALAERGMAIFSDASFLVGGTCGLSNALVLLALCDDESFYQVMRVSSPEELALANIDSHLYLHEDPEMVLRAVHNVQLVLFMINEEVRELVTCGPAGSQNKRSIGRHSVDRR